ncbi:isochorismatase family protein family [Colletotrichum incanum]|uniref:Isochorismatase family protein family n=1 Tax=Colletotrichum incanum TaxID=1573173 RepID=A0A161X062_COLIC|nr:isochorismatase family protein family [Colletotrichum incanum]OHW99756.1 isochorismatase [Colletotrichum incanum]
MFPFDVSAIPTLPTRKGLLVVDFQNDFLSADGVLPVVDHDDLVARTVELVKAFRKVGDVIWVCTEFDKFRPAAAEHIWATDALPKPKVLESRARRRPQAASKAPEPEEASDADPEAFLSQPGPKIVRAATPGAAFPDAIKEAMGKRDVTFIKSHYSAFTSGQLLQTLRVKFVHELYICGSLANIGVYATAMDAAKFGYSITLVENCCGFCSDLRQTSAIRSLVDVTGCEVDDSETVIEKLQPKATRKSAASSPVVPKRVAEAGDGKMLPAADAYKVKLVDGLAKLSLGSPGSRPSSSRSSNVTGDSDCATVSDPLEVDPAAQPPKATVNDSPDKEASSKPSSKEALELGSATSKVKDAIKEPQIPKAAVNEKASSASDIELEPDLAPHMKTETKPESKSERKPESKPESETEPEPKLEPTKPASEPGQAKKQAAMDGQVNAKETSPQATEPLCEGDTTVIHNILPAPLAEGIFEKVRDEVLWQRMSHQGGEVPRLVAVQGEVADDGSAPVYRHPSDESPPLLPFSPTVQKIKAEVEKQLGHPLNHALIQFYRDGTDYISEHSDKTLDIVKGSYIANVSLGAERTMVLRTKRRAKDPSSIGLPSGEEDSKQRTTSRAKLPHNSLCRMGLVTNMRWLHAIRQDKRADRDKTAPELAFSGGRISLTFRQIGTFLDRDNTLIWGQGATGKTREEAHTVINGQSPEAVRMLQAFGTENHSTEFDWDKYYGKGFDVLHMSNSPRLCASSDPIVNMRIALMLAEYGVTYAKGSMSPSFNWKEGNPGAKNIPAVPESLPIRFVDNDAAKSTVQGELAIMLYLDAVHASGKAGQAARPQTDTARVFTRFQQGLSLLDKWRRLERHDEEEEEEEDDEKKKKKKKCDLEPLQRELAIWEGYASEADFIAGPSISLADFAVWPVLHAIVEESDAEVLDANKKLKEYYEKVKAREPAVKILGANQPDGADANTT